MLRVAAASATRQKTPGRVWRHKGAGPEALEGAGEIGLGGSGAFRQAQPAPGSVEEQYTGVREPDRERRHRGMRAVRWINRVGLGSVLATLAAITFAWSAESAIATQTTKDVVITLKNESGQWAKGRNRFAIEFTSARDKQPIDAGKVTLSASMTMRGMAPMVATASLSQDKMTGRYLGTIAFPDSGAREVTMSWDGPAGKGLTTFSVRVR
jgi:hypothetical protein